MGAGLAAVPAITKRRYLLAMGAENRVKAFGEHRPIGKAAQMFLQYALGADVPVSDWDR